MQYCGYDEVICNFSKKLTWVERHDRLAEAETISK